MRRNCRTDSPGTLRTITAIEIIQEGKGRCGKIMTVYTCDIGNIRTGRNKFLWHNYQKLLAFKPRTPRYRVKAEQCVYVCECGGGYMYTVWKLNSMLLKQ